MSALQQQIFNFLLDNSWETAMSRFQIASRAQMQSIIIRTALGYWWDRGCSGGQQPWLSYMYEEKLVYLLEERHSSNDSSEIDIRDLHYFR